MEDAMYKRNGTDWREWDYTTLVSNILRGVPIDMIAKALERSPTCIRAKLTRLGLNYDGTAIEVA
jgi:hypothetical protein